MKTSKLNVFAAVLVIALVACGQNATKPAPNNSRPLSGRVAMDPPTPSPVSDYGAAPVSLAGPLPGQNLPLSGPIPYPLLIQVENSQPARPQAGLQAASAIFEYLAEGGITRFSALYHRVPGVVGPVRSARFISVYLFMDFGAVLMASGGSGPTYHNIFATNVWAVINDFDHGVHFFRWDGRPAPHNVYTTQAQMLSVAMAGARPVRAEDFPRSTTWSGTEPATSISVPDLTTRIDFSGGTYGVTTDGSTQDDVEFGPVRPQSVAVLHVHQSTAGMPLDVNGVQTRDFDLTSGGTAELYAHGTVIRGRWDSPGPNVPIRLLGPDGHQVSMPPGLLWVSLAQ